MGPTDSIKIDSIKYQELELAKDRQYSFSELGQVSPLAAQEMIENMKMIQMQISETFYHMTDKIDTMFKEMEKVKGEYTKRLDRIEKILRGGGDLLEDI
jgi:hypothetical protein